MRRNNVRSEEEIRQLFEAILSLQTKDECYDFFSDLCTVNEVKTMALRLEVAKQLLEGATYLDIIEETQKGSAIIFRVKSCLNHGRGGFRTLLERLNKRGQQP
ncbi:Trp operon repressor family [Paenibacillus tianmuensis]|uniref:Trp operon repressor family n=1 Tax=Paenibacillus tianmuensis TaxID=624147 RepID=A0A1G4R6W4_9BACL|nr:YerC/YecD family TrpR-related protein [Paenibacillus tianmuensis]SCW52497.1 Trp operon repressor family [Paenibacillus tianmuensis]